MNQVEELERALLARAERLASAYLEMTQRSRDTILRDAAQRLRRREQRATQTVDPSPSFESLSADPCSLAAAYPHRLRCLRRHQAKAAVLASGLIPQF